MSSVSPRRTGATLLSQMEQAAADAVDTELAANPNLAAVNTPGAEGEVLTVVGGVPDWAPPTGGGGTEHIVYLNDFADVKNDNTGDMGAVISAHLVTMKANGQMVGYLAPGVYRIASTLSIPANMTLMSTPTKENYRGTNEAQLRPSTTGLTMVRMGNHASLIGIHVDLFGMASTKGVSSIGNEIIGHRIEQCSFGGIAADSFGVWGGSYLYFTFKHNAIHPSDGVGVSLLDAHNPLAYYGVNVAEFDGNIMGSRGGAYQLEGIFTIRDNRFEGTYTAPVIQVMGTYNSYFEVSRSYFEIYGTVNKAVYISTNSNVRVHDNEIYGNNSATAGGRAVSGTAQYSVDITGNFVARFQTAWDIGATANGGSWVIEGNDTSQCGADLPNDSYVYTATYPGQGNIPRRSVTREGQLFGGAAVVHPFTWMTSGSVLDLRHANVYSLTHASATTLTHSNARLGLHFTLIFHTANITLNTATWNLKSGTNETPAAGSRKNFVVAMAANLESVAVYEV